MDKQKILDIIQSAKKHKNIKIYKHSDEPIIVYKKRIPTKIRKKRKTFLSLPAIPPSSFILQEKYKGSTKKTLFTTVKQNKDHLHKTVATPIVY